MGYQMQKFLRRNKGVVLAASLVFLALLLGMIGTTIGLFHADHQRSLAELARDDEIKQRRLAIANGERAKANFDQARAAVEKMLTRTGEQTLRDVPGFDQIRRQLLKDALAFHQEFLAMAQDDSSVQSRSCWSKAPGIGQPVQVLPVHSDCRLRSLKLRVNRARSSP
jgi:hypothetical protein